MDLKIVKLDTDTDPLLLGASSLPHRVSSHITTLVNTWKDLVDPFQALSLFELASRVRHVATDVDHEVDATLLIELGEEARDFFSNQSRVLYRLDDALIP